MLGCDFQTALSAISKYLGMEGGGMAASQTNGKKSRVFSSHDEAVDDLRRRRGEPSAVWRYHDVDGQHVGTVLRWDRSDAPKEISQMRWNGRGWVNEGMPRPKPLYRLPETVAAINAGCGRVFVVEGEKSADAGQSLVGDALQPAVAFTTSVGGSGGAKQADWSHLAVDGLEVVVIPDHDEPGRKYANAVAEQLSKLSPRPTVKIIDLSDDWQEIPDTGDVADFVEYHDGAESSELLGRLNALADRAAVTPEPASKSKQASGSHRLVMRAASDVEPQTLEWLWPGRIPLGKLTLISGDPGLGKSLLTVDMAARVSTGRGWPDGYRVGQPVGSVILFSAEDDVEDTIRPRLDQAGADCSKVFVHDSVEWSDPESGETREQDFTFQSHLQTLDEYLERVGDCRLVCVDPMSAYFGSCDSHRNAESRALLKPLARLASRHRVAIVYVDHLTKSAGKKSVYRSQGSIAFSAAARAVWIITKDQSDPTRRLFVPSNMNLAPDTSGLAYTVADGPVLAWEDGPVFISADDAMDDDPRGSGEESTQRDEAREWLEDMLADGPVLAKDIYNQADDAGFSKGTVKRAKSDAGIEATKEGFQGKWAWKLSDSPKGRTDSKGKSVRPFESDAPLWENTAENSYFQTG